MTKVLEIQRSFKHDNMVAAKIEGTSKWTLRKVFETKNGNKFIRVDNDEITFTLDENGTGSNIQLLRELEIVKRTPKTVIQTIKEEIAEKKIEVPLAIIAEGEVKHEKFDTIKACVENNIPVYLVGPAGSGKNHTLESIAKELALEFYFTNSIQQEYKLTGFIDAGGKFHETEFYKAFTQGGLFFLDEMDASIPEVLVLLNAAIANRYFEFPTGRVEASVDFRVVAAGNTFGNGADEQYTGRLTLDQATLDRFAVIEFGYCTKVELHMAKNDTDLVSFIHNLRTQAEKKGIRATFSYRCISMVIKLKGVLQMEEVLKIAVFKGMDKDTLNTLSVIGTDAYSVAARNLKK